MTASFWSYYFGWWQGGVWPNLAASAVTGSAASAFTVWRMRLHHRRTRAENEQHRDAVTAHVTAQLAPLHRHLGTTPTDGGDHT